MKIDTDPNKIIQLNAHLGAGLDLPEDLKKSSNITERNNLEKVKATDNKNQNESFVENDNINSTNEFEIFDKEKDDNNIDGYKFEDESEHKSDGKNEGKSENEEKSENEDELKENHDEIDLREEEEGVERGGDLRGLWITASPNNKIKENKRLKKNKSEEETEEEDDEDEKEIEEKTEEEIEEEMEEEYFYLKKRKSIERNLRFLTAIITFITIILYITSFKNNEIIERYQPKFQKINMNKFYDKMTSKNIISENIISKKSNEKNIKNNAEENIKDNAEEDTKDNAEEDINDDTIRQRRRQRIR